MFFDFEKRDEVPDDEEVAGEFHLLDHGNFEVEALDIIGEIVLEIAGGAQGFKARASLFKAHAGDVGEVGIGGFVGGNVEAREGVFHLFELDVAALGDFKWGD